MAEIKNVLVTVYVTEENRRKLIDALAPARVFFVPFFDTENVSKALHENDFDVVILNADLDDEVLTCLPNLKWAQCCHAGLNNSARPEVFERGIILTSSSGRSAPSLGGHALMFMLYFTYDLPLLLSLQREHKWGASREYYYKPDLYGRTLGIIGTGKSGRELARLAKSFDMRVLGYKRSRETVENMDVLYAADEGDTIDGILRESDFVVLASELNDQTYHIIDGEALRKMKRSAYLINIGRGSLIDEPALIEALQNGVIAGAGLDTFEKEPLSAASPLWDMPNVLITPHMTPMHPQKEDRMLSYVFRNIEAYKNDGEFVNRVTEKSIYTKGRNK